MRPHYTTAAVLGLLLAGTAACVWAGEAEDDPGAEETKPKITLPPRAELDRLISKLGPRVDDYYPARTKLREYLDAEDNRELLEAFREALPKVSKIQRFHIVRCLGDWGKPEGLQLIVGYVTDKDDSVQRAAMSGIGRAKEPDKSLLSSIRPLLNSPDDNVRKEAILTVGRMKDTESLPVLMEMVKIDNTGLRTNIVWALREITGKDFGTDLAAWDSWYDFYQQEILPDSGMAVGSTPGRREAQPIPKPGGSGNASALAAASTPQTGPPVPWAAILSGLAALLVVGGWLGCRLWLGTTMKRLLKLDPSARSASAIAARFAASDLMPGFIVYPFLMGCISKGSPNRVSIALHVLMFRVHGGCRRAAGSGGRLPQPRPVAGGRDRVLKLPRGVLSDMALVGNFAGRCLIRIAEPDNPAWKRDPNDREVQLARRHLAERPQSDN